MRPTLAHVRPDRTYILNTIRAKAFVPGKFTGASGKPEILKLDLDPLLKNDPVFFKAVGLELAQRHLLSSAYVDSIGGPSDGGEYTCRAFNIGMVALGHAPLPIALFPKDATGKVGTLAHWEKEPETRLTSMLMLDDLLNRAGSALRTLAAAKSILGLSVPRFDCIVIRSAEGEGKLKRLGILVDGIADMSEVISPENASAYWAFYGAAPYKRPKQK